MAAGGSFQPLSPFNPRSSSDAIDNNNKKQIRIRSVWSNNLDVEFRLIQQVVDRYPFISIDTEFPGVVYRRDPILSKRPHDLYTTLKENVDQLKLIQVGITLTDFAGNLPDLGEPNDQFIWEFNFSDFDVSVDEHNPDSIELLRKQGINLVQTRLYGIPSIQFADLMMSSGLVCNDDVTYISFHSAYDFGYLVKLLTGRKLPESLGEFMELLQVFFGRKVYDVKQMIKYSSNLHGGLDRIASSLGLKRGVGKSHQAGSDSLLTWQTFQRIRDNWDIRQLEKYVGVLFGLDLEEVLFDS